MTAKDIPLDLEWMTAIRHELHMYPELGWDLPKTSALVRRELEGMGVSYEADVYGENSIVATINPHITDFTIGIRGDMDALPIQENNPDLPYCSRHEGIMHACGHDAHTAMLLGTARALHAIRDQLKCRVKLIFQPCEESRPSGAEVMCRHGVMRDIDCIIMCHVNCGHPLGVPSTCSGVTNATSTRFSISLKGKSVHVAAPHCGIDALAMGFKIYEGIQTILGREVDPFDTCVISVCTLHAGDTISTNADTCEMGGSIRCLKDQTMAWVKERLERLVRTVCEDMRGQYTIDFGGEPLPCAVNDDRMYQAFLSSAKKVVDRVIHLDPSPGGEDFAYYELEKPGLLFGLGLRNEETGCDQPAHTRNWRIDDSGMENGVRLFLQFVLDHQSGIDFSA